MPHQNAMGQPCDGVACSKCTRCSNCKHQKPGEYKEHYCVRSGVEAALVTRKTRKH